MTKHCLCAWIGHGRRFDRPSRRHWRLPPTWRRVIAGRHHGRICPSRRRRRICPSRRRWSRRRRCCSHVRERNRRLVIRLSRPRQIPRRTRRPVVGWFALKGRYFVSETRRVALRACETPRCQLQLLFDRLRLAIGRRLDVNSPLSMRIATGWADRELASVKSNRRPGLISAARERAHKHTLLAPTVGHDHDHSMAGRWRNRTAAPLVDDANASHCACQIEYTGIPRRLKSTHHVVGSRGGHFSWHRRHRHTPAR